MSVGIRFESLKDGQTWIRIRGCPLVGQWLKFYDPDARDGIGEAEFTSDVEDAIVFATFDEAQAFWSQQSTVAPMTTRNEAFTQTENRPLTVVSVTVDPLPA